MYSRDLVTAFSTWIHIESGSTYTALGIGLCSTNGEREHKEESVVYVSHSFEGLRYREVNEFLDGRFVRPAPIMESAKQYTSGAPVGSEKPPAA